MSTYRRFAPRTPTLNSEVRRGLHPRNLSVGLGSAAVAGGLAWATGWESSAVLAGVLMFLLVTLFHVSAHAYVGWRIQRGMAALAAGDHARARCMLSIVLRPGMEHYDPRGAVRLVLSRLDPVP